MNLWILKSLLLHLSLSLFRTHCVKCFISFYSKKSILICFFYFAYVLLFLLFCLFDCHCQRRRTRDSRSLMCTYTHTNRHERARDIIKIFIIFFFSRYTRSIPETLGMHNFIFILADVQWIFIYQMNDLMSSAYSCRDHFFFNH